MVPERDHLSFTNGDDLDRLSESIIRHIDTRVDDLTKVGNQRHVENLDRMDSFVERLDTIVVQTTKTNGRVNFLERELEKIRDRWHKFRTSLEQDMAKQLAELPRRVSGEDRPLTRRELTIAIGTAAVVATAIIWIFTHLPVKP